MIIDNLLITSQVRSLFFDFRALIAIGLVIKHGVELAEVAGRAGVATAAVSKIIKRDSNKLIQSTTFSITVNNLLYY